MMKNIVEFLIGKGNGDFNVSIIECMEIHMVSDVELQLVNALDLDQLHNLGSRWEIVNYPTIVDSHNICPYKSKQEIIFLSQS